MSKRVYLLGYFGVGAWADDLIGMITAEMLREAAGPAGLDLQTASTHLHARAGPAVAEFFNRRADLVIFAGGSLLGRLRLSPFDDLATWIDDLRVPLIILGTGWREEATPLDDHEIARMRRLLEAARATYLRGHYSLARLSANHLPLDRVSVLGDPGLCFRQAGPPLRRGPSGKLRVGVVARNMDQVEIDQDQQTISNAAFHAGLASVLDHLVDNCDAEIYWFPMTSARRPLDNDFAGLACVAANMRAQGQGRWYYDLFDRPYHEPGILARTLGTMDLVISQRLHGTLIALAQGVATWPIEYQFAKCYDALSIGGLKHQRRLITRQGQVSIDAFERLRQAIFDGPGLRQSAAVCGKLRERYLSILRDLLGGRFARRPALDAPAGE